MNSIKTEVMSRIKTVIIDGQKIEYWEGRLPRVGGCGLLMGLKTHKIRKIELVINPGII